VVTEGRYVFSARCNIYISCLCYDVSVRLSVCLSVCDGSALGRMPGTQRLHQPAKLKQSYDPQQTWPPPMEGSSRAVLATAMPSCYLYTQSNGSDDRPVTVTVASASTMPSRDSATHVNVAECRTSVSCRTFLPSGMLDSAVNSTEPRRHLSNPINY